MGFFLFDEGLYTTDSILYFSIFFIELCQLTSKDPLNISPK